MKQIQAKSFRFVSLIIGVLAFLMIFLPVLIVKDTDSSFTGIEVAFGTVFASVGSYALGEISFNPIVLLAFVLPLAAALIIMTSKRGYLITGILFVVSAALIFMIPQFTTVTVVVIGEIDVEWTYGLGLILAGVLCILGALVSFANVLKSS